MTCPGFTTNPVAWTLVIRRPPAFSSAETSAAITSFAFPFAGNTRPPRSATVSSPCSRKNRSRSSFVNCCNALNKNFPFPGMLGINSFISQELVILHLPFPVIIIFFPGSPIRSSTITFAPCRAAVMPAIRPAAPPPITITLDINLFHLFHSASLRDAFVSIFLLLTSSLQPYCFPQVLEKTSLCLIFLRQAFLYLPLY